MYFRYSEAVGVNRPLYIPPFCLMFKFTDPLWQVELLREVREYRTADNKKNQNQQIAWRIRNCEQHIMHLLDRIKQSSAFLGTCLAERGHKPHCFILSKRLISYKDKSIFCSKVLQRSKYSSSNVDHPK